MTKLTRYLCFLIYFLPYSAFAANFWVTNSLNNFELSAAVGPNWAQTSSTHLVVSPYETDSVLVNNISNYAFWKIGVGYHFFTEKLQQRSFFNDLLVELNLYQSWFTVTGDVWQYQLPQFNNFTFKAPITSTRLMLDVKPTLITVRHISFYPILGVGNSWNNVAYNEVVSGQDVPDGSNYLLNTSANSNFAFDVGVGLRADFNEHISASVEYLYTNLGNVTSTGTSKNSDPIIATPTFNIYNQGLLLGLSWKL
jgi:opacity protein-like surface antigen